MQPVISSILFLWDGSRARPVLAPGFPAQSTWQTLLSHAIHTAHAISRHIWPHFE
jgi:hypothetical protein